MNPRKKLVLLMVVCATPLAACSSGGSSSLAFTTAPYYIGPGLTKVDTDYIDRYACANGQPMRCESESRVRGSTAYCRCPL